MAAMYEFLQRLDSDAIRKLYQNLDAVWNGRAQQLNARLAAERLPIRVANLSSIWTVCYTQPACYHWMFQYYLKAQGLAFSWVGTGRFIFSLNYSDADFTEVLEKIVSAAHAMHADGWWWSDAALTHKLIRRRVLKELLATYWARLRGRTSAPWHGGPVPQGAQARALDPIGSISSPRSK